MRGGGPYPGCTQVFTNVQAAVDFATGGEIIKVASGVYTDVSVRPQNDVATTGIVTQVVYISKTITIQGGYTPTNWTTPHPITQPTTLDAQGQGRVIYVTGDISTTIEGLRITGGNANRLSGGALWNDDAGGGMYIITATAMLRDNQVFNSTAGGGWGDGGGLSIYKGIATLDGNRVFSNTGDSHGGGLYVDSSTVTLNGNIVTSNTAIYGGGLHAWYSNATFNGNTFRANTAGSYSSGIGGGLLLYSGTVTLNRNTIISNTSRSSGGLHLWSTSATLDSNIFTFNMADGNNSWNGGGGLSIESSQATLLNNIIADNRSNRNKSGLAVLLHPQLRLLHTTVARNIGGDGSGISVTDYDSNYSTGALTDTIFLSQTVGITVTFW